MIDGCALLCLSALFVAAKEDPDEVKNDIGKDTHLLRGQSLLKDFSTSIRHCSPDYMRGLGDTRSVNRNRTAQADSSI